MDEAEVPQHALAYLNFDCQTKMYLLFQADNWNHFKNQYYGLIYSAVSVYIVKPRQNRAKIWITFRKLGSLQRILPWKPPRNQNG